MIKILSLAAAAWLAITCFAVNLDTRAYAHGSQIGEIMLIHPWARPSIPNRPVAAYLTISNDGETPDRLIGARSEVFEAVELHMVEMQGDLMTMKPVDAVDLPAGETVALEPGGFHLMLFGATRQLSGGDHFPLTITFEKAGEIEVDVVVEKRGAEEADHSHTGQSAN